MTTLLAGPQTGAWGPVGSEPGASVRPGIIRVGAGRPPAAARSLPARAGRRRGSRGYSLELPWFTRLVLLTRLRIGSVPLFRK